MLLKKNLKHYKTNIIFIVLFFFIIIFSVSCDIQKYYLFFDNKPFTKKTSLKPNGIFEKKSKIYFLIYAPKGFDSDFIRVQVLNKSDKVPSIGYSIVWSKDYILKSNEDFFTDYFIINQAGNYIVQIFYHNNLRTSFVNNGFIVK